MSFCYKYQRGTLVIRKTEQFRIEYKDHNTRDENCAQAYGLCTVFIGGMSKNELNIMIQKTCLECASQNM